MGRHELFEDAGHVGWICALHKDIVQGVFLDLSQFSLDQFFFVVDLHEFLIVILFVVAVVVALVVDGRSPPLFLQLLLSSFFLQDCLHLCLPLCELLHDLCM